MIDQVLARTQHTRRQVRAGSFLVWAFFIPVFIWSVAAVITLIGVALGGGVVPSETPFLVALGIFEVGTYPVSAGIIVAVCAFALLRNRRDWIRHPYGAIWILATAYILLSAVMAYLKHRLFGNPEIAPIAAGVFLFWGGLIAYAYAALVAAAFAIAEKLNIVSSPRMDQ